MFENWTIQALAQYWWVIISLLGALLVFLLFVQGGQTMIYQLGRTPEQRTLLINALGHKWELTFTTLVTFGGAFFASFPLFYATSFSGAYWVWMLILFCFVVQAVSYEFRSKAGNFLGARTYEIFLYANGLLGTVLLGVAVATFFTGSQFALQADPSTGLLTPEWKGGWGGLELAFDFSRYETFVNLSLGASVFYLARLLAALYFKNAIDDVQIASRATYYLRADSVLFLVFFLFFLINLLLLPGASYDQVGLISMEPYKYLHNLIEMPLVLTLLAVGIAGVLAGLFSGAFTSSDKGIWPAGIGTVLVVFSLFLIAGLNHTCYYPSSGEYLQSSIYILNSSSSHYTLSAMSYVSLLVPFVAAYIWVVWRAMNRKRLSLRDMDQDGDAHLY